MNIYNTPGTYNPNAYSPPPAYNSPAYGPDTFKEYYSRSDELTKLNGLNKLYDTLSDKLLDNKIGLDPLKINSLLFKPQKFNDAELNRFYRHLLNYTYASTALEVKNHEEVNEHLKEIHRLLQVLVKEKPQTLNQLPSAGP
jgi:hypothetical protein